jgi:hypothetical protein
VNVADSPERCATDLRAASVFAGLLVARTRITPRNAIPSQLCPSHSGQRSVDKRSRRKSLGHFITTPSSRTEIAWERVVHAVLADQGFLIYPQPFFFYWLPRHSFARQLDIVKLEHLVADQLARSKE